MSRIRSRAAITAGLMATAVAASCLTAGTAQAATGPAVTDGGFDFAARLQIGDNQRACTAVLVASQWLATAASCFADDLGGGQVAAGKPKWKTKAVLGPAPGTNRPVDVVELVPRADRDMVLARLATPVSGTPVPFATTPPVAGEELTVAGFGRTKDEWVAVSRHTASFTVQSVSDTTIALDGKTDADAICAGDAGGPLVRQKNGKFELVALASQSWQGGCWGSDPAEKRNDAVSPRLDNVAGGNTLTPGAVLRAGDSLIANAARLTLQADGNLVVVSNGAKTLWSTGTAGHPGATARFDTNGNLAVLDADGSTVLWESGTTAPGGRAVLQNRGNFVIQDARAVSQWAAGTVVRHDYTGDGRSDLAEWYDYGDGHDEIHAFPAKADGGFDSPVHGWDVAADNYWAENMKRFTGDFNGDGIGDVAAFYGYSNGDVGLITWLGQGGGYFSAPLHSWKVTEGWSFSRMTVNSGDFNGDGRDDVAVWYDYADGSDKLHTFLAKADGGFNNPFSSFSRTEGWSASNMKFTTGDYNSDGRDDLAALYGYATGEVKLITFPTTPAGGFDDTAVHGWSSTGWNFGAVSMHSGDFNGDGRDDLAAWYDYGDGHDAVIGFTAGSDGKFGNRTELWNTPAGNYGRSQMKIVTGDYNGDGRDDLASVYGYADGRVKTITWTAKADGTLNSPLHSWEATSGWTFDAVHVIERYNSPA
ncbi:trypsin-like serine protease [Streptomyces lancefieldiae]|uniref:Trypsin-like serine protease n=1 Tax=Streptomyces lancefieldiae TaxID=3075520 RepID=A0ABU3AZN8_9ACTN|nr:trypsin-like serine protease [Streptomyces sp. DSM 40712]MDT0615315.1 trypsin-like serine protease [Streptomyces sp. DSM 40712]